VLVAIPAVSSVLAGRGYDAADVCTITMTPEEEVAQARLVLDDAYRRFHAGEPCPATLEELVPRRRPGYRLRDPWGNPYRHGCTPGPAPELLVISAGPDGKFGTGDEITGDW
jgi:hypothetical protein